MTRHAAARRLVTFGIGTAWYAVDVVHVERVLRHDGVFPIPNMPSWMEGMVENRGRIVPVVDLRRRLGLDGVPGPGTRRLLVLSLGDDVMAAAVDRVVDVRPVAEDEVTPPPGIVRGLAGECLLGVLRRDDTMVLVLDVPRLLQPDDRRLLDDCLQTTGLAERAGVPIPAGLPADA